MVLLWLCDSRGYYYDIRLPIRCRRVVYACVAIGMWIPTPFNYLGGFSLLVFVFFPGWWPEWQHVFDAFCYTAIGARFFVDLERD